MSESIKDKALRYRHLSKDETFVELMEVIAQEQVDVFLSSDSSTQAIDEARSIVLALKRIESAIQSVLDAEAVFDKQNS